MDQFTGLPNKGLAFQKGFKPWVNGRPYETSSYRENRKNSKWPKHA